MKGRRIQPGSNSLVRRACCRGPCSPSNRRARNKASWGSPTHGHTPPLHPEVPRLHQNMHQGSVIILDNAISSDHSKGRDKGMLWLLCWNRHLSISVDMIVPDLSSQSHRFADLQTGMNPLNENVSLCACHENLFNLLPSMSLCHKCQNWNQLQLQMCQHAE